jgi:hypothetical protein
MAKDQEITGMENQDKKEKIEVRKVSSINNSHGGSKTHMKKFITKNHLKTFFLVLFYN